MLARCWHPFAIRSRNINRLGWLLQEPCACLTQITNMITPTPTDAAMAAARQIREYLGYGYSNDIAQDFAAIIDRHFAPLREENDKLREALEKSSHCLSALFAIYRSSCDVLERNAIQTALNDSRALLATRRLK